MNPQRIIHDLYAKLAAKYQPRKTHATHHANVPAAPTGYRTVTCNRHGSPVRISVKLK